VKHVQVIALGAAALAAAVAPAFGGTATARLDRHDRAMVVAVERHRSSSGGSTPSSPAPVSR
jgi:hypothetical protein